MTTPTTTIASEIARLQAKIDAGKLDPETPAFVLLGTDVLAAGAVTVWAASGRAIGVPEERVGRAMKVAEEMRKWRKIGSGVPGNRGGESGKSGGKSSGKDGKVASRVSCNLH